MEGKFKTWHKILELFTFLLILVSSIYNGIYRDADKGIVITLSFVSILLFVILLVAALFPATWRMTDKQKEKIKDLMRYQENYTSIFVIVNMVLSIFMSFLIWTIS